MRIIDITLNDLYERLGSMGYSISLDEKAKDFVAEKGFDPQYGARPLHRAIQKYIEDPLAEFILGENPAEGTKLTATLNDNEDGLLIHLSEVESDVD